MRVNKYCWYTSYKRISIDGNESKYNSYVIAETIEIAKAILVLRDKGEVIDSGKSKVRDLYRIKSVASLYKNRKLSECVHTLCFLAEPFINAGVMKPEEFLADFGLIHEISHELDFVDDPDFQYRKSIYNLLKNIDKLKLYFGY